MAGAAPEMPLAASTTAATGTLLFPAACPAAFFFESALESSLPDPAASATVALPGAAASEASGPVFAPVPAAAVEAAVLPCACAAFRACAASASLDAVGAGFAVPEIALAFPPAVPASPEPFPVAASPVAEEEPVPALAASPAAGADGSWPESAVPATEVPATGADVAAPAAGCDCVERAVCPGEPLAASAEAMTVPKPFSVDPSAVPALAERPRTPVPSDADEIPGDGSTFGISLEYVQVRDQSEGGKAG